MNVLMVQNRFEQPILDRIKNTTIRPPRKDGRPRAKPGEQLSIRVWTGAPYRSKQREILQVTVKFVMPVEIDVLGIKRTDMPVEFDRTKIAKADGFKNWREMRAWFLFTHGLPFTGVLIHWE